MNLVQRVKSIILTPASEWQVIEREPGDASYLFTNYVAILALIPPVCGFIGTSIIGVSLPGAGTFRVPIFTGLFTAVFSYVLTLVVVYVMGLIIDMLAPRFGGQKNAANALKLSAYSYTPGWLVGIFLLIPGLSFLSILGLYAFYLLWIGIPILMKAPKERALMYTVAVVVIAIVIAIVIGAVQTALIAFPG